MKKVIFLFGLILTLTTCDKEDNLPPNNNGVYIKTLSHRILEGGGISLTGEIGGVELPIDYGFIVSTIENETYSNRSNSKIFTDIHNGNFTYDFKSNLRNGITYYYNTMALRNGEYIYGNEKSFVSNGSVSPIIESVVPQKAHLGDTITINGKYFSNSPQIFFNTWSNNTLIANDTLIKCIVINNHDYNKERLPFVELKIRSSTSNESIYNEFALHTPIVDSIRPFEAYPGDTITLYGDHFNRKEAGNRLIINGNSHAAYPRVIKSSQKELTFVLREISRYKPTITLESQSQSIEVKNKIKHVLPQFVGLSKTKVKYGDKLVVYGSNFPNDNSYTSDTLRYWLGSKHISFQENFKDSLLIDIDDSRHYEGYSINGLSIDFFGHKIDYNQEIELDENYVRTTWNTDKIISHGTIGEDLYAVAYPYYFSDKYLIKFNKTTNNFEKLYPDNYLTKAPKGFNFSFHGTKFYSFNNDSGMLKFYDYDIFTNQENELAPFPGTNRNYAFITVVGNYIYYGLGRDAIWDELNDIWRYSITDNQWEFVVDFPSINSQDQAKTRPLSFSIGDKLYIGGGQADFKPQLLDFWELDTNTKVVSKKADLPITMTQRIEGSSINGKGCFDYNGLTYIYDPLNDSWYSKDTGINFNGQNKFLLETEDVVYGKHDNSIIKIKKSHFNN